MTRTTILESVIQERNRQDKKWGGPLHDIEHSEQDWEMFIKEHCHFSLKTDFRKRMIEVAALAIAAIESHDLRNANY